MCTPRQTTARHQRRQARLKIGRQELPVSWDRARESRQGRMKVCVVFAEARVGSRTSFIRPQNSYNVGIVTSDVPNGTKRSFSPAYPAVPAGLFSCAPGGAVYRHRKVPHSPCKKPFTALMYMVGWSTNAMCPDCGNTTSFDPAIFSCIKRDRDGSDSS